MKLTKRMVRFLKESPEIVKLLLKLDLRGRNFIYFQFDAEKNIHILGLGMDAGVEGYNCYRVLYKGRKALDLVADSFSFLLREGLLQECEDFHPKTYYALQGEWFANEVEWIIWNDLGRPKTRFAGNPKLRKILRGILNNLGKYTEKDLKEEKGCFS